MALTKCRECGESISKSAKQCPKCGSPAKKKTSIVTWIVAGVLLLIAAGYFTGDPVTSSGSADNSKRTPRPSQIALENTELKFTWRKVGFDNVMEADFEITNRSAYSIKDIRVRCTQYGESGTHLDSNRSTIYNVVPPGATKTFKDFNMGFINPQSTSTSCIITDLSL